jgi:hypothetical protein
MTTLTLLHAVEKQMASFFTAALPGRLGSWRAPSTVLTIVIVPSSAM